MGGCVTYAGRPMHSEPTGETSPSGATMARARAGRTAGLGVVPRNHRALGSTAAEAGQGRVRCRGLLGAAAAARRGSGRRATRRGQDRPIPCRLEEVARDRGAARRARRWREENRRPGWCLRGAKSMPLRERSRTHIKDAYARRCLRAVEKGIGRTRPPTHAPTRASKPASDRISTPQHAASAARRARTLCTAAADGCMHTHSPFCMRCVAYATPFVKSNRARLQDKLFRPKPNRHFRHCRTYVLSPERHCTFLATCLSICSVTTWLTCRALHDMSGSYIDGGLPLSHGGGRITPQGILPDHPCAEKQ
eukprot:366355-Chlamydomonas_euryale.AAC.13